MNNTKQTLVYKALASHITARINCEKSNNADWFAKHTEIIELIVKECLPSGSGFDSGTEIELRDISNDEQIVFETAFHHMNGDGFYTHWSHHQVKITPSFDGINLKVSGRDSKGIKEYIAETFYSALLSTIEISADGKTVSHILN